MNAYELIGQVVVYGVLAVTAFFLTAYVVRYLAITYAFIYTHCVHGAATKEYYKQKLFWRVRLAFKLLFSFGFITSYMSSCSVSSPFFHIDLEPFFPKVTIYKEEV